MKLFTPKEQLKEVFIDAPDYTPWQWSMSLQKCAHGPVIGY